MRPGWTTPPFTPGQSVFNNYLNRIKLNYQFTKELSLRLILDYNTTIANARLLDVQTNLGGVNGGPFAPTKLSTTDVLLTYLLLHPGTAVYAGYNNGFTDLSLANVAGGIGPRGSPANTTNPLFFVKLSYLFPY